jgi:hypothetical protein
VDAARESVDHIVESGDAGTKQAPPLEARQLQCAEAEDALGSQVVDGESRGDLPDRTVGVDPLDQVRHQSRKRVVDMDHIREELQGRQHLQERSTEEDGSGVVVSKPVHAVAVV